MKLMLVNVDFQLRGYQIVKPIPPVTSLTPIGLEALVLKISRAKRTESPLKLDKTQALSLINMCLKEEKHNI